MEEIEAHPIVSSPKYDRYDNLPSNYHFLPMGHENGNDHLTTKNKNDEDEDDREELRLNIGDTQPKKIVRQFYFVKVRGSFVDPTLSSKIENAKELRNFMYNAREIISAELDPIKEKICKERDEKLSRLYLYYPDKHRYVEHLKREIEYSQRRLENEWPEDGACAAKRNRITSFDHSSILQAIKDLEPELEPKPEPMPMPKPTNVDKKIQELKNLLIHGSGNIAEERKTMKKLKYMQRGKEQSLNHDQTTVSQRPRWYSWSSKEYIQHSILESLKKLRDLEEGERKIKEKYEVKKVEVQKEIIPQEKKLATINKKITWANQCILAAIQQQNEQTAYYNEQFTLLSKAKELAMRIEEMLQCLRELSPKYEVEGSISIDVCTVSRNQRKKKALAAKKHMMALEELSSKQVEQFMSQWTSNDAFRANYKRSIAQSLVNRKLGSDGRVLNPDEIKIQKCQGKTKVIRQ